MQALGYPVNTVHKAPSEQVPRERLPLLWLPLGLFVVGAVGVSRVEGFSTIAWSLGMILAVSFLIASLRTGIRASPENLLYIAWVGWALMGAFEVISPILFWQSWFTVLQIWVLTFIVSNFVTSRKALSFTLGALLVGTFIVNSYSFLTGEYAAKETLSDIEQARVAGLATNANVFAWIMILATMAMAYFWILPVRWQRLKFVLLAIGMAAAAAGVVASASRMGIIGLVGFYGTWIWFCYRKAGLKQSRVLFAIVLGVVLGGYVLLTLLSQSVVAERFVRGWEGVRSGRDIRIVLLLRGLDLMQKYPLTGVGLGNFRFHYPERLVAHSEYAEVGADTGWLGAALYFSIFVVLWRRAGKIAKYSDDEATIKVAKLIRAILIVVMVTNLSHYNYDNKESWIMFGSFIGYTSAVWRQIQSRFGAAAPADTFGVAMPWPASSSPNLPAAGQGGLVQEGCGRGMRCASQS